MPVKTLPQKNYFQIMEYTASWEISHVVYFSIWEKGECRPWVTKAFAGGETAAWANNRVDSSCFLLGQLPFFKF